jgi:hypothetical protein
MPDCHIIQIEDEPLFVAAEQRKDQSKDFYAELGEKIYRLCKARRRIALLTSKNVSKQGDFACENLDISATAIAWRGLLTAERDEVLYWGAALKPLHNTSDGQLNLAAKRIQDEMDRRAKSNKKKSVTRR